jgi:Holliday junction resolvase-like predicted endonuclease
MIRVCSGCHPRGLLEYGLAFLQTFDRHWPTDIDLKFYTEKPIQVPRGECRSLWDCDGAKAFADRHAQNIAAHGRAEHYLRPKEQRAGYSYRFDAVKFFKQLMIPEHAAKDMADGDILIWLDADVISHADVPVEMIEGLLSKTDLVYLGRQNFHPDIAFWAVRLNPSTRMFLTSCASMYRSDAVLRLPEWHSAYVWDHCRGRYEAAGGRARNLTPLGRGAVWLQSPLYPYSVHLKGKLKAHALEPQKAYA